ncbi:MAG: DUF6962 family protein [Chitinophagales bacterium]
MDLANLTSITIGGITITEPVTSLTDIILSIISFTLFTKVKSECVKSEFHNAWRMFFLFMGITTTIGAITHGLAEQLGARLHYIFWMFMTLSPSVAVYFSVKATILFSLDGTKWQSPINFLNVLLLIIFFLCTLTWNNFEILKIHAGIGVFIIFITHLQAAMNKHIGSGMIVSAFSLSFITILIHSLQISAGAWFNYKDISHVLMMASLILIYTGVYRMSENLKLAFTERRR